MYIKLFVRKFNSFFFKPSLIYIYPNIKQECHVKKKKLENEILIIIIIKQIKTHEAHLI